MIFSFTQQWKKIDFDFNFPVFSFGEKKKWVEGARKLLFIFIFYYCMEIEWTKTTRIFRSRNLFANLGIICGPGLICGRGSFVGLYNSNSVIRCRLFLSKLVNRQLTEEPVGRVFDIWSSYKILLLPSLWVMVMFEAWKRVPQTQKCGCLFLAVKVNEFLKLLYQLAPIRKRIARFSGIGIISICRYFNIIKIM